MYKPHYRLTVNGTVYGEKCSFGLSLAGDQTGWPAVNNFASVGEAANQCVPDVTTFLNSLSTQFGTSCKWQGLRVAGIDENGKTTALAEKVFASEIVGTGTSALPGYLAQVATLLTDRPGRAFRGRIYLPFLNSGSFSSAGQVGTTVHQATSQAVATLITNLNNAPGLDAVWGSFQCVIASGVGTGNNTVIKSVRVNSLLETQRRRANETPAQGYTLTAVSGVA